MVRRSVAVVGAALTWAVVSLSPAVPSAAALQHQSKFGNATQSSAYPLQPGFHVGPVPTHPAPPAQTYDTTVFGDHDGDQARDNSDNCPSMYNAQLDLDGDGVGDVCDPTPGLGPDTYANVMDLALVDQNGDALGGVSGGSACGGYDLPKLTIKGSYSVGLTYCNESGSIWFYQYYSSADDPETWKVDAVPPGCTIPSSVASPFELPGLDTAAGMPLPTGVFQFYIVFNCVDTDGDGLSAGAEPYWGTSDSAADFDGDGLTDGDEVHKYFLNPTDLDSDAGGTGDGAEIANRTDPTDPKDDRPTCAHFLTVYFDHAGYADMSAINAAAAGHCWTFQDASYKQWHECQSTKPRTMTNPGPTRFSYWFYDDTSHKAIDQKQINKCFNSDPADGMAGRDGFAKTDQRNFEYMSAQTSAGGWSKIVPASSAHAAPVAYFAELYGNSCSYWSCKSAWVASPYWPVIDGRLPGAGHNGLGAIAADACATMLVHNTNPVLVVYSGSGASQRLDFKSERLQPLLDALDGCVG